MKQEKEAIRTGIYIDREILNRADEAMGKTNARSRSEFISEALEFYIAWLHSGEISKVLTPALESVIPFTGSAQFPKEPHIFYQIPTHKSKHIFDISSQSAGFFVFWEVFNR